MSELDFVRIQQDITRWQVEGLRRVRERMAEQQLGECFSPCAPAPVPLSSAPVTC